MITDLIRNRTALVGPIFSLSSSELPIEAALAPRLPSFKPPFAATPRRPGLSPQVALGPLTGGLLKLGHTAIRKVLAVPP